MAMNDFNIYLNGVKQTKEENSVCNAHLIHEQNSCRDLFFQIKEVKEGKEILKSLASTIVNFKCYYPTNKLTSILTKASTNTSQIEITDAASGKFTLKFNNATDFTTVIPDQDGVDLFYDMYLTDTSAANAVRIAAGYINITSFYFSGLTS